MKKKRAHKMSSFLYNMAEKEGFEPSVRVNEHSLSRRAPSASRSPLRLLLKIMAEEVGFEPTELSFNGFQDRRLQPLGHSSTL